MQGKRLRATMEFMGESDLTGFRNRLLLGGAAMLMAFTPGALVAQDQQSGIQDIVVTARKTSENLQATPVAVTAFTSDDLNKQQVVGVTQLQQTTPNLTFSSAVAQPGSATIFMRGQGSSDGLIAIDQAVGAYINGVYMARSTGGNFDMVDVERVEVLRGPQGTLFGRNTTGGAINIIPNQPTGELEGSFRVDYGNYESLLLRGVVNVPILGDEIAVRVAGQHRQRDGYGRNLVNGEELNDANSEYIRATLKIDPVDSRFSALLSFDYSDFRNKGELVGLKSLADNAPTRDLLVNGCNGIGPTAGIQPLCDAASRGPLQDYVYGAPGNTHGFYDVFHNARSYGKSKSHGFSAIATYDLADEVQVKSTTAWRSVELDALSDNDGTPYHFTGGFGDSWGNRISQDQFSQELQFSGTVGIVDYILGGFYFVENGTDRSRSGSLYPLSTAINNADGTIRNQSLAGYGQLIVHVTDDVRVTGGLRYTEDKRKMVSRNRSLDPFTGIETSIVPDEALDGDPNDPFRATFRRSFNYVSWLGAVDWQASQNLFFYGKVSRSQRSGGFNTRIAIGGVPPLSFVPERVTDYEAGAKLDLLDRRVRFNIAAFNTDVKNVQRNVIGIGGADGRTLVSGVDNAAKSRIRGVETELTIAPGAGFTFGGTFGLTDASYRGFINSIDGSDWSDSAFPYTSKYNYSIRGDYETGLGDGTLKLHADWSWRSKQYSTPMQIGAAARVGLTEAQIDAANHALQETARINGYGLLNARIAYAFDDPGVEIAVFAQNITKKKYMTRLLALENVPFGLTSYSAGDPRTYGMSLSINF